MQCFSIREHYSKEIIPFSGIAFISVKLIGETSNYHGTHIESTFQTTACLKLCGHLIVVTNWARSCIWIKHYYL